MKVEDVQRKGFHERFHTDGLGRVWDLKQLKRVSPNVSWDHRWNRGSLVWVCRSCGSQEPVRFSSIIHDEVIVPHPGELDAHDCDLERVRSVMDL